MSQNNLIFAGIHIKNKPNEILTICNIDFNNNVDYLRNLIAKKLDFEAKDLELIYNGHVLSDDLKLLSELLQPNATIHCFAKTKKYAPYVPSEFVNIKQVQQVFSHTSHIQMSVTSRVNVLQKVLTEYPEFRRNLGAMALIRDSVLFNTLHEQSVVENLAKHYPLICDAAVFIVNTIRKELARNNSATATRLAEAAASDSTTSSEEENSMGASGSSSTSSNTARREELANIRQISRQQLEEALAQVNMGGSFHSLSNIAQRNTDANAAEAIAGTSSPDRRAASVTGASSAAPERISSDVFRQGLQRALISIRNPTERMDTNESTTASIASAGANVSMDDSDILPPEYRQHQYAEQLRTMAQMGFTSHAQNIDYLTLAEGNIEYAISLLMA